MSEQNGIVHLSYLPENRISVRLVKPIQTLMINRALEIVKIDELSNLLKINKTFIYNFKNYSQESFTLSTIKDLSDFLLRHGFKEFSLDILEQKIELIRAKNNGSIIHYPNFPIDFNSKEGARIISSIFFDGGINKSTLAPFYTNNEEILVKNFITDVKQVVGDIEFYKRLDENTFQVQFPRILGYILVNGLSLIPGKKVFTNPTIPTFILNGHENMKKAFLRQAFDDEGSSKVKGRCIEFVQYNIKENPPLRLIQLKNMITALGIVVNKLYAAKGIQTKTGYTTYGWYLTITNHTDILKFKKEIDFSLMRKQKKLNYILNSYKLKPFIKRFTAHEEFLKTCLKLENEDKRLTIKNVSIELGKGRRYTNRIVNKLEKEGYLKSIKNQMFSGYGSTSKEFKVSRKRFSTIGKIATTVI